MESSRTPAPESGSGTAPPPPPPADRSDGKAGGGWRALAVVLALALAFGVAVMFVVAINPDDTPRCEQITSGEVVGATECYDITETQESVQMVLAWAAGVVGAIALLLALAFAATGRRGSLLVKVTVAALVLGAIVVVIGQL